jgi:hypothetical protein
LELCQERHVVQHKMTPSNLGVVFGPNMVRHDNVVVELEWSRCAGLLLKRTLEHPTYLTQPPSTAATMTTASEENCGAIETNTSEDVESAEDGL